MRRDISLHKGCPKAKKKNYKSKNGKDIKEMAPCSDSNASDFDNKEGQVNLCLMTTHDELDGFINAEVNSNLNSYLKEALIKIINNMITNEESLIS